MAKFTMTKKRALEIAQAAGTGDSAKVIELLRRIDGANTRGTWKYYADKLAQWIDQGMPENTPFSVWNLDGNNKLPFASFSTLPGVTCPGAGACWFVDSIAGAGYCYTVKSWRYPTALFRQVQNSLLIKSPNGRKLITKKTLELPNGIDCRLYVDGDFDSLQTVTYWFVLLRSRPDLRVYGYSKSWQLLLDYASKRAPKIGWPDNYLLNLSNGASAEHLRAKVSELPIVRGDFIAVEIDKKLKGKYDSPEYKRAVRQAGIDAGITKAFVCPGKCGECTKSGHFCGRSDTKQTPVLIGVH